ncbi:uncharacterized protein LOC101854894 isoform X2 [Aplysia californica]|uniref:Uncharacterized protein LOC101854894 isoform X2 n=1 Tax=Aplysia californica TaxID=6500 RepID=A0ABM1VZL7_APLCA|nr:uncharacterized protein LOC101854894 isoform X2 [Aplysia californica]
MAAPANTSVEGLAGKCPDVLKKLIQGTVTFKTLSEGKPVFDGIKTDFEKAGLNVVKVLEVKNHFLRDEYENEKGFLNKRKARERNFSLNEVYLYHGTNESKEVFLQEGMDNRLASKGLFGKGIYFSDDPKKCLMYAERGTKDELILLTRVLLGESKVYEDGKTDRSLKREPKKENPGQGSRFYDSVQGRCGAFREFVIYEKRRALVECIITFTKVFDDSQAKIKKPVDPSGIKLEKKVKIQAQALSHSSPDPGGSNDDEADETDVIDSSGSDDDEEDDTDEKVVLTQEEEKEMTKISEELAVKLKLDQDLKVLDNMKKEDKDAVMVELVSQFCEIVGLDSSLPENDRQARTYLSATEWKTDLAVLAYFEESYGIS